MLIVLVVARNMQLIVTTTTFAHRILRICRVGRNTDPKFLYLFRNRPTRTGFLSWLIVCCRHSRLFCIHFTRSAVFRVVRRLTASIYCERRGPNNPAGYSSSSITPVFVRNQSGLVRKLINGRETKAAPLVPQQQFCHSQTCDGNFCRAVIVVDVFLFFFFPSATNPQKTLYKTTARSL